MKKIRDNIRTIFIALLSSIALFAGYIGYRLIYPVKPTVVITVFVHGTVGSSFNFLNPFQCLNDSATDETWGVKALKKYRNSASLRYDQIFGDEGLIEFSSDRFDTGSAAHYLIAAFDELAQFAGITAEKNHYTLFGWSGLLSHQARSEASKEFYCQLTTYYNEIKNQYGVEPELRIIAHSHGGNVALLLAEAEHDQAGGLQVDTLFMLGTPMQRETADYITSKLFKNIILGYSLGDAIQGRDYFSTVERQSYIRMADVVDLSRFVQDNPDYRRADMQFIVDGDDQRITHTNMWLLARSVPILSFMDPLPLVAVVPLFIAQLKAHPGCTHYEAHLKSESGACDAFLLACTEGTNGLATDKRTNGSKLFNLLFKWRNKLFAEWRKDDISRHAVFNTKNLRSIFTALTGW